MAEAPVVVIRSATESDLPAMEWEGEYAHFRRLYRRALAEASHGRRRLLLAEVSQLVVGQLFVQLSGSPLASSEPGRTGYLYAFRVRPAFRNQGIGTRLVHHAEACLREKGHRRAVLSVAKENLDARRLYERLGYCVCAEDPGEWSYVDDAGNMRQVSEPAYVLEKRL